MYKLHIRMHNTRWGVWRDRFSSTYALPVVTCTTPVSALTKAIRYLELCHKIGGQYEVFNIK